MLMRRIACLFYMNLGRMFVVLILHLNEILLSMKKKTEAGHAACPWEVEAGKPQLPCVFTAWAT